jgi:hypothetical protein
LQAQKIKLRELLDRITLVPEDDIHVWDWTKSDQLSNQSIKICLVLVLTDLSNTCGKLKTL